VKEELMSDQPNEREFTSQPSSAEKPADPQVSASEAWGDVLGAMASFGEAVSTWARAALDEPENRKHLEDLRAGVSEMAREADAAVSQIGESEFGKQLQESAMHAGEAIGGAASEFGQTAAPHVATAFTTLAEVFSYAAEKVTQAATPSSSEPAHTSKASAVVPESEDTPEE
jgi:hypothetical protein